MTISRSPKTLTRLAALAAILGMTAAPALAMAAGDVEVSARSYGQKVSYTVSLDDTETDEDVANIYKGLEHKAEAACMRQIPRSLGRKINRKRCEKQLMKGFVKDLNHDGVTALHDAR